MFRINLGRGREKIVAVADIGSGSAAVAIVLLRDGAPAEVLAAHRAILPIEERTKEATIAGIGQQLIKAGEEAQKAYSAVVKKASAVEGLFVIMRAPWTSSKTARAAYSFPDDTVVTKKILDELSQKCLAEDKDLNHEKMLEASVVRVEINGYATAHPIGKKARMINVYALLSDCDPAIMATAEQALGKAFPHLKPKFHSSTRALVTVLREQIVDLQNYLIVDMVSEGTTCVAVRDGVAVEHLVIAEGVRTILKRLSATGMPEETLSLLRMYARDQCSGAACETIASSIARVEPELVRLFGEAIAKYASLRRLPNRLILAVHPDLAPWLVKFFSRIDFTQFTLTSQPFSVQSITSQDLAHFVTERTAGSADTGLMIGCGLVALEQV